MKLKQNKKGFTLVELIVIMAVIGILVLLAIPKFMGYTKDAKFTKLISNAKQIETASERLYMDKGEWPRLSDEPYTSVEIKEFAQKIYDATGKVIELDPNGYYYDIDYDRLGKYISVPYDKEHYILQNPVGTVYALDDLTEKGQKRFPASDIVIPTPTPKPNYKTDLSGYSKVIYVDMENGNDTTGDGTENNPYKTFNFAYTKMTSNVNQAMYLKKGTYEVSVGDSVLKRISIFGEGKETTLYFNINPRRVDGTSFGSNSSLYNIEGLKFYRLIFKTTVIGQCLFASYNAEFYNVAFDIQNAPYDFVIWGTKLVNCIDIRGTEKLLRINNILINCYGKFALEPYTSSSSITKTTSLTVEHASLDANYRILDSGWKDAGTGLDLDGSPADIGVYGGTYAWK